MTKDLVKACPNCDSTGVQAKSSKPVGRRVHSEPYTCNNCAEHFEEPIERERKSHTVRYGLARKLADASPDDVGGDDD